MTAQPATHLPAPVRLTPLGHSCVLLEVEQPDGRRGRVLLDPGSLTAPVSGLGALDAVLVTHAHADHVDPAQIRLLQGSARVPVHGNQAVAELLDDAGLPGTVLLEPGPAVVGGVEVVVAAAAHEAIYPGVPLPDNLTFLVGGRVFAPGDAFAVPPFAVDVLLLPTGAPWMKLAETVDYLRAVAPRIAVPVHDGGLVAAHQQLHRGVISRFAPEGTTVLAPVLGESLDLASV